MTAEEIKKKDSEYIMHTYGRFDIVLDHGNVVERGTHEELMKNGGAYTQLVSNE